MGKRFSFLTVLLAILIGMLVFSLEADEVRGQRLYDLEHEWASVWINTDGSIDLWYNITIELDSGPDINFVYISQPRSDFSIVNATDQYGNTLEASNESYGANYVAKVILNTPLQAGQAIWFTLTTHVPHMLYQDMQNPSNVGLQFTPCWWSEASVLDLRVLIVLPQGVTADEVVASVPWNHSAFIDDHLAVYWERQNLLPNQRYTFGVSFPKVYVHDYRPRIYILADGRVDPETAPINSTDKIVYTVTDEISAEIVVERGNIIVDGAGCKLQGDGRGYGFNLTRLSNVTIMNANIQGFECAVYLNQTSGSILSGNNFTNNGNSILLWNSSSNIISGNDFVDSEYSHVFVAFSLGNTIFDNVMSQSHWASCIRLASSSNNIVVQNSILSNDAASGVDLHDSSNNTIAENDIMSCAFGAYILTSNRSTFYHNNFINNTLHVYDVLHDSTNFWDNGVEGNYWSNYTGVDSDRDGIGDTPHVIDATDQDNFPLMGPISLFEAGTWGETTYQVGTVSNSTVSDFHFSESEKLISFSVAGQDGAVGFCRVAVPNALLGGPYVVLVDGSPPLTISEWSNGTHTFLCFTYNHSVKPVEISGTIVIPEFPTWIPMLLLFLILAAVITIYERRLLKTLPD